MLTSLRASAICAACVTLGVAAVAGSQQCDQVAALSNAIRVCSGGAVVPDPLRGCDDEEGARGHETLLRFVLTAFDCASAAPGLIGGTMRKTLVINATGTLEERLLIYAWARSAAPGRLLLVIWQRDFECAASFDELFMRHDDVLFLSRAAAGTFAPAVFNAFDGSSASRDTTRAAAGLKKHSSLSLDAARPHIYVDAARWLTEPGLFSSWHDADFIVTDVLRALVPKAAVLSEMLALLTDLDVNASNRSAGLTGLDWRSELHAVGVQIEGGNRNARVNLSSTGDAQRCDEYSAPVVAKALRAACKALIKPEHIGASCTVLVHVESDTGEVLALRAALDGTLSGSSIVLASLRNATGNCASSAAHRLSAQLSHPWSVEPVRCVQARLAKLLVLSRAAQVILPRRASADREAVLLLGQKRENISGTASSFDTCTWAAAASEPEQSSASPSELPVARVSAIVACCGRHAQLRRNLPFWLGVSGVDEVVIVDWSSTPPLRPAVDHVLVALPSNTGPPHVMLARVDGEDSWVLSRAFNVGFRLASAALILKLDCDVQPRPSLILAHLPILARLAEPPTLATLARAAHPKNAVLRRNAFVAGDWRRAASANEMHLNGMFIAWAETLRLVGGFDERITTYGWDDSDLFSRLGDIAGAQRRTLNASLAEHVAHTSAARLEHSAVRMQSAESVGDERVSTADSNGSSTGTITLANLVGALTAAELKLNTAEAAVIAIQQNRIALESLPNLWGHACDGYSGGRGGSIETEILPKATSPVPSACGDLSRRRQFFEAWCGSDYEWIQIECAADQLHRAHTFMAEPLPPMARSPTLTLVDLRRRRATASLQAVVGPAGWLAAWYQALAQELPGIRAARAAVAVAE